MLGVGVRFDPMLDCARSVERALNGIQLAYLNRRLARCFANV